MMTNLLHGAHAANKLFSTIARLRLLLVMFLTLTISAEALGAEKSITLTYNTFGLTTSYAQKTATVDGFGFTVNQGYKGTGDVIQMNSSKGNGALFNTTSIKGLKSITINVSSGSKTYTITSGTSQNPTGNSQTGTSTKTFSIPSGDTYFQLKVSGASYFTSIVIVYDESSSEGGGAGAGSEGTLVITRTSFPSGALAYNTTDNWSAIASTGETVSGQGDLYSTASQTTMQTKNTSVSTHYHNTTAMPGSIKKISMEMASGTNRSYTVYASTSQISSTTGLTSIGTVKSGTPIEIDPTKGYKYFWLQCTGGASFLNHITLTYQTSGITQTTITLNPNGGTISDTDWKLENGVYKLTTEDESITLPEITRTGYTFAGWAKSNNGEIEHNDKAELTELDGTPVVLYAQWTANSYTVIFNANGGTGEMDNQSFNYDEKKALSANEFTRKGHTFVNWNNTNNGSGDDFDDEEEVKNLSTINEATYNLYAQWECVTPTISTQPQSATYLHDDDADALSVVAAASDATLTYQWKSSNDNSTWSDITGATEATYKPSTQSVGTTYYQVVVTNSEGNCSAISDVAIITVRTANCKWVETEIGDIESGDEVVIAMTKSEYTWALNSSNGTTTYPLAEPITIKNQTIASVVSDPIIWNISGNATDGYVFYPDGSTTTWLYCTGSNNTVKVGTGTAKAFYIENNYLKNTQKFTVSGAQVDAYVGVSISTSSWRHYPTTTGTSVIADQTLKFYKKECLPIGQYWINYELTDVVCTDNPVKNKISTDDNAVELNFEATGEHNELPTIIIVTNGSTTLAKNTDYTWSNGVLTILNPSQITDNITISIAAQKRKYTVTFDANGHGTAPAAQSVTAEGIASVPTAPEATGYTFVGWYTDSECTNVFDFATPITGDITLYAKWTVKQYNVTLNPNYPAGKTGTFIDTNGNSVDGNLVLSYFYNTISQTLTDLYQSISLDGYQFNGWYNATAGGSKWTATGTITKDITLYAQWTPTYTITWLANGHEFHKQENAVEGTALDLPDSKPDAATYACNDKVFVGWTEEQISGSTNDEPADLFTTKSINVETAAKTYYAVFATVEGEGSSAELVKMTADDDFNIGDKLVIIAEGTQYGLYQNTSTKDYVDFWTTDDNDGVPTLAEIEEDSKKYFEVSAGTAIGFIKLGDATNGYLYLYNSSSTNMSISTSNSSDWSIIAWTDNTFTFKAGQYLSCRTDLTSDKKNKWRGAGANCNCETGNSCSGIIYYNVYKYTSGSLTSYSDYVTTCAVIPDPVWNGAVIDNAEIAVECGTTSYKSNASKITFPTERNYDLTYPITITASEGFLLSTNKDNDRYKQTVTVTPNKGGENPGRITTNVWVRAVAPAKSEDDIEGTITLTGKQIETQVINVTAIVTCQQYTLKLNDRGIETEVGQYYAGTEVPEPATPTGVCGEYEFDGWSTTPVDGSTEYDKVTFSYAMPNKATTLYAVYSYTDGTMSADKFMSVDAIIGELESGKDYVLTGLYDSGGDDKKYALSITEYETGKYKTKYVDVQESSTLYDDGSPYYEFENTDNDIIWTITGDDINGYTFLNKSNDKYLNVTNDKLGLSNTPTAFTIIHETGIEAGVDVYYMSLLIQPKNSENYLSAYHKNETAGVLFNIHGSSTLPLYLYKRAITPLYTTTPDCHPSVTLTSDGAVYVTATNGRGIMAATPLTLTTTDLAPNTEIAISSNSSDIYFSTERNTNFAMAQASQPKTSLTLTTNEGGELEKQLYIHYKPSSDGDGTPAEVVVTADVSTHNPPFTAQKTIHVRNMPAEFVIATKAGATWYALPANMSGATNPAAVVIEVDETTMTATAPNTTPYTLWPVATINGGTDRYQEYGERLRFAAVNNGNKGLWTNNSIEETDINNYAAITAANSTAGAAYEWKVTTTIVDGNWQYTLYSDQENNKNHLCYRMNQENPAWGTYASNEAQYQLYFLPIKAETTPFDYQVVEWYPNKVLIQTSTTFSSLTAKIAGEEVDDVTFESKDANQYEVTGLPLLKNPTKALTLEFVVDAATHSGTHTIPVMLSGGEHSISDLSEITKGVYNYTNLVVRDGAKLTIDGSAATDNTFYDVTIYPTAKILVPEGKQLSVHRMTFIGGITEVYDGSNYTLNKYGVPELSLKGTLGKTVTTMDYIMRVNLDQMYSLGVPYDVALADIKYWDGSAIGLGTQLYVSAYDGQARANLDMSNTWTWEVNFAEKVLKAGIGYTISAEPQVAGDTYSILRMPMKSNISSGSTEGDKTVSVTGYANTKGATITDNHKGWNLLSNPYMASIKGDSDEYSELMLRYMEMLPNGTWQWTGDEQRYVSIPYNDGSGYYQLKFSEAVLEPFKNFFVQVGTSGELNFELAHRQDAPARYMQAQKEQEVEFELLLGNGTQSDNTGLLIAEKYSPAYEINADLEKMTGSMSVFTIYNGYQLAYNALSPINAEEQIPVGYIVPAQGEYTFDLKERGDYDEIEHIYLTDRETDAMVDLLEETYTFYTTDKKNNNRFAINVILKEESHNQATDLDNLDFYSNQPQKFLYDGRLYILLDGKVYSATGHEIKTINE